MGLLTFNEVRNLVASNNNSGLSDEFIICQIFQESSFNQGAKVSYDGGRFGLMQVGASAIGQVNKQFGLGLTLASAVSDPGTNITAGTSYVKIMVTNADGDVQTAMGGYGTGSGAFNRINACANCLKGAQDLRTAEHKLLPSSST